jgi:hypothetical protein
MIRAFGRWIRTVRFAREILLVGGAYLAYELVRSFSAGRAVDAFENTELVVRAEQALGIFAELNVQVAVLSYSGLVDFFSLWYFWGHFPLIVGFAIFAFCRHNRDYVWARNAVFLAGGIGLIVYLSFPVAPPRLIPGGGFVDTLRDVFALQYDNSSLINEFAAVPSLHQGFALIMGGAFYRIIGGRVGMTVFAILPAIMFVSIVVTANHWFIDAILGAMVALVAMWAVSKLERHGDQWFALVGRLRTRLTTSLKRRFVDRPSGASVT